MKKNIQNRQVGTIPDIIQYFKQHQQLFQSQQSNKSHMERVMAVLNQDNMEHLQKQFQLYEKGLQLPTFIYLMKKLYVPDNQLSKYFFVADLIKFFQAIDINGDGHLQWSQFTEYIIENIRVVEKPKYKNILYEQNEIISSAYSKISNEYKMKKLYDINSRNIIKKMMYSDYEYSASSGIKNDSAKGKGCYFILEEQSNSITVHHTVNMEELDEINMKQLVSNLVSNVTNTSFNSFSSPYAKTFIEDFSLDKTHQIIGILYDGVLYFTNLKVKAKANKYISQCPELQSNNGTIICFKDYNKIKYLDQHKLWCVCSKTGSIVLLDIKYTSRINITINLVAHMNYHKQSITEILELDLPSKFIITSSLDGTIKLYSKGKMHINASNELQQVLSFEYIPQHMTSVIDDNKKKSILGIDGSSQFGNYVLSYGFNNQIYLYSLDMSLTRGYANKYIQHSGNIISASFLKMHPQILSLDDKLNLRIWDFRRLQTIQLINCEKIFINPSQLSILIIPEQSRFLISEKKITEFKAPLLQQKSKQINQFHDIFDIKYSVFTNQVFIFTSIDIRIYNYYTGNLKRLFTKLYEGSHQTNITAAQFGYKNKRIFLGDAAGCIRQFCSETGDFLQNIHPKEQDDDDYENRQITKIVFLKDHSLLVCCSIDGRVMIYERTEESEYQLVRDFRQCHPQQSTESSSLNSKYYNVNHNKIDNYAQVTCAAASSRYCLLATGDENGAINIWNLDRYMLQGMCVMSSKIVNISFLPIYPVMVVATSDGYLNLVYVRPYDNVKMRNKCFARIRVINQDEIGSVELSGFSCQLILRHYLPEGCPLLSSNSIFTQKQSNKTSFTSTPSYNSHSININENKNRTHHLICTIGTTNSKIRVLNLNGIVQFFGIQQNHQIYTIKKSQRTEIQNMKGVLINERSRTLLNGYTNIGVNNNIQSFGFQELCWVQIDTITQHYKSSSDCNDYDLQKHSQSKLYSPDHPHQTTQQNNGIKQNETVRNIYLSKQNAAVLMKGLDKKIKLFSMVQAEQNTQQQSKKLIEENKETVFNKFIYKCTGIIQFSTFKKQVWMLPQINLYKKLQFIETTIYSIKLIESKKFTMKEQEKIRVCLLLNEVISNVYERNKYYDWISEKIKYQKSLEVKKLKLQSQNNQKTVFENVQNRKTKNNIPKNENIINKRDASSYYGNLEGHQDYMSQTEFNQVYQKLISSINKSLGSDPTTVGQNSDKNNNRTLTKMNHDTSNLLDGKSNSQFFQNNRENTKHDIKFNKNIRQNSAGYKNQKSISKTSTVKQLPVSSQLPIQNNSPNLLRYRKSNSPFRRNGSTFNRNNIALGNGLIQLKSAFNFQSNNKENSKNTNGSDFRKRNILFTPLSTAQKWIQNRNK